MMYERYDKYLCLIFSDDYWSDIGISEAAAVLSNFCDADWAHLSRKLHSKDSAWQKKCAETLSESDAPQVVEVLVELLDKGEDVSIAAADSLNSLSSMGREIRATASLRKKLTEVKFSAALTGRLVIEALEKKLID
jgi:hypothetical protein